MKTPTPSYPVPQDMGWTHRWLDELARIDAEELAERMDAELEDPHAP